MLFNLFRDETHLYLPVSQDNIYSHNIFIDHYIVSQYTCLKFIKSRHASTFFSASATGNNKVASYVHRRVSSANTDRVGCFLPMWKLQLRLRRADCWPRRGSLVLTGGGSSGTVRGSTRQRMIYTRGTHLPGRNLMTVWPQVPRLAFFFLR